MPVLFGARCNMLGLPHLHDQFYQYRTARQAGFTLVELMIAMSLFAILYSVISLSLSNMIPRASVTAATEILVSDLRSQQLKAMVGETSGSGDASDFGIYFEPYQYTLFSGSTLAENPASHRVIALDQPLMVSVSAGADTVLFAQGSGALLEPASPPLITVQETQGSGQKSIQLNALGVVVTAQ